MDATSNAPCAPAPGTDTPLLLATNLNKRFGSKVVVHDCCLRLGPGIVGIIGANGIGKSTLLSLLSGSTSPDSGDIFINGVNLHDAPVLAKSMLSCAPRTGALYPFMTGADLLALVRAARPSADDTDCARILAGFSITHYLDAPFLEMSEGTKQKFALTAALIGHHAVLLLDEPSNALDAAAVDFLCAELRARDTRSAIAIASHDQEFLARLDATVLRADDMLRSRVQWPSI